MTITVTMNQGVLNTKTNDTLYAKLMDIECSKRGDLITMTFEPNKEYIFEGVKGKLSVTFSESDFK